MKHTLLGLGLVLAMGCGNGNKADKLVGEMEGFRDKMCACKDAACAEKVTDEQRAWKKGLNDKFSKDELKTMMSDDQQKRGEAANTAFKDCRRKVRDAEKPNVVASILTQLVEIENKMCACKDTACATKVSEEMTALEQKRLALPDAISAEDQKKMGASLESFGKCKQAAMTPAK